MNLLFANYWKQIIIATAVLIIAAYIALLKHDINGLKRDNTSLNATIEATKALGQAQNEETARIEEGSRKAAQIITDQYSSDLKKVKAYYAKNPVIKRVPVSVCNTPTRDSASQMPTTDTSTQGTDEGTADLVPDNTNLAAECAVTTLMLVKLQEFEQQQR